MKTQTSTYIWIAVVILIILGAWYWWPKQAAAPETSTTTTDTTQTNQKALDTSVNGAPAGAPQVKVLSSITSTKLGAYLVAANGMTLYKVSTDGAGVSNCKDTCLDKWIPYTVNANNQLVGSALVAKKIATLYSGDTTKAQLTYDNAPLYFYVGDKKAGDVTGNGIGGVWSIVTP